MKRIFEVLYSSVVVVCFAGLLMQPGPAVAQPSTDINTYVLFAYSSLQFQGGQNASWGNIYGGNVGVNAVAGSSPTCDVGTSDRFYMSDNTCLVADRLRFGSSASAYNIYYNKTYGAFGGTIRHASSGFTAPLISNLPSLGFTPGRAATASATDYADSTTLTLAPGTYRNITVASGGILNLSAGTYDINNLSSDGNTTVNVSDGTILRIDGAFSLGNGSSFGVGTGGLAEVLVGSSGVGSGNPTINFGSSLTAYGLFFAPNGALRLGGNNNLFGRYWANTITSDLNDNMTFLVPEPSALVLISFGLIAYLVQRRRRSVSV